MSSEGLYVSGWHGDRNNPTASATKPLTQDLPYIHSIFAVLSMYARMTDSPTLSCGCNGSILVDLNACVKVQ